jgi:hypothetical protein
MTGGHPDGFVFEVGFGSRDPVDPLAVDLDYLRIDEPSQLASPHPGGGPVDNFVGTLGSLARRATPNAIGCLLNAFREPEVVGLEPVLRDLDAGRCVILVTNSTAESFRVVRDFATRLNRSRASERVEREPCPIRAVVAPFEAGVFRSLARGVRLFGRPFDVSDSPALLAEALGARIFPTFATRKPFARGRIRVGEAISPKSVSDLSLQRTGQRIAWAFERFLREESPGSLRTDLRCTQPDCRCH